MVKSWQIYESAAQIRFYLTFSKCINFEKLQHTVKWLRFCKYCEKHSRKDTCRYIGLASPRLDKETKFFIVFLFISTDQTEIDAHLNNAYWRKIALALSALSVFIQLGLGVSIFGDFCLFLQSLFSIFIISIILWLYFSNGKCFSVYSYIIYAGY